MRETKVQGIDSPTQTIQVMQGLTIQRARDLLDWLEAQAITQPEIVFEESGLVTVRWLAPFKWTSEQIESSKFEI